MTLQDGKTVAVSLNADLFAPSSLIEEIVYNPTSLTAQFRTTRDDTFSVDLLQLKEDAPLDGRPTIYLDQNHWSTLTAAIYRPAAVSNLEEREAAARLIELASAREVVLPLSTGHMLETCKQVNFDRRYERALIISRLSSGWQLRRPVEVRGLELQKSIAERNLMPAVAFPPVVTLAPESQFVSAPPDTETTADLPVEFQRIWRALTCVSSLFDTLLDSDHLPVRIPPEWAAGFQRFAEMMRTNPMSGERKRRQTLEKFTEDLGLEFESAARSVQATPQKFAEWCDNYFEKDLPGMPALSLYREVIHEKLCNDKLRWRDNDLIDMMYLTTAAGYCDHVVAERSHAAHIKSALRRLERPDNVHRSLRHLIDAL